MKKVFVFAVVMLIMGAKSIYAQNEANDGILLVPQIYDNIDCNGGSLIIVEKNKKMGVVNSEGKLIIPPEFDDIEVSKGNNDCGGLIKVCNELKDADSKHGERTRNYGLYNSDGNALIQCDKNDYEAIYIQENGYGFEGIAKVWVFKELKKVILDYIDDGLDHSQEDTVWYNRLTKSGVLLENGTLNTSYDDYQVVGKGLIVVGKDRKKGLMNKKGEIIIPIKYDDLDVCKNYMVRVEGNGANGKGRGILDDKGNILIPIGKYKNMDIGMECLIVENNKQKGALSLKGVQVIPFGVYDKLYEKECEDNRNHYICVYKDGKIGAANCNGKVFIPCGKYDRYEVLDNNLALVSLNSKKGLINRNGIVIVPVGKYADIKYKYGVLYYSQNGKYGVLDKKGKQATLAIYDEIEPERHSDGIAYVKKSEKTGIIDCEGHIIMPLGDYISGRMYDDVGILKSNEGTVFFLKDGKILSNYGKFEEAEKKYGVLKVLKLNANEGLFVSEKNTQKGIVKLW